MYYSLSGSSVHEILQARILEWVASSLLKCILLLLSCFSRVRLCATPETAARQAPPSLGFSRQEHEWLAISFSNAWKWKVKIESEVAQSCPTLGNPMDCSLPGSSIHGIFQARVLERGVDVLSYLNCLSYAKKFTVDPIMFCVFFFWLLFILMYLWDWIPDFLTSIVYSGCWW